MKLRPMTAEDVMYVKDNSISHGLFGKQPQEIDYCYTLEHEGVVLCVGGIRVITPHTAWAWVDLTCNAQEHIAFVYKQMWYMMEEVVREYQIKRLQAYVEVDFKEAIRLVEHLGFKRESVMKNFVGDKHAYMYVKFAEDSQNDKPV